VKRRDFITLLGSATAAWPLTARAHHPDRMRRVGILMNNVATEPIYQNYVDAFVKTLLTLGWRDGQNVRLDVRWSAGDPELTHSYAMELVATRSA
jgi:hypothetical protein